MTEKKLKYYKYKDLIQIILIVIVVSYLLKMFVLDTLSIPSSSMEKTLLPGDFVVVNKFYYDLKIPRYLPFTNIELKPLKIFSFNKPKKGDVIAFYLNSSDNLSPNPKTFIKRCVAEPGDSVVINGVKYYLPKKDDQFRVTKNNINILKSLIIKDGSKVEVKDNSKFFINNKCVDHYKFENNFYYFVGDNYFQSIDSRNFGPIPEKDLIGKVVLVYWSVNMDNMIKSFLHKIRWNRLGMLVW